MSWQAYCFRRKLKNVACLSSLFSALVIDTTFSYLLVFTYVLDHKSKRFLLPDCLALPPQMTGILGDSWLHFSCLVPWKKIHIVWNCGGFKMIDSCNFAIVLSLMNTCGDWFLKSRATLSANQRREKSNCDLAARAKRLLQLFDSRWWALGSALSDEHNNG